MSIYDHITESEGPSRGIEGMWYATIKTAPPDVTTGVFVAIKGFHPDHRWGPCRWMPRVDDAGDTVNPTVGDVALVGFDDEDNPWVICWWPQGSELHVSD